MAGKQQKRARKGQGAIKQRTPMGCYRARIVIKGKQFARSFQTREAAADWLASVRADHGDFDQEAWLLEAKNMTLAGALRKRLVHISDHKNIRNERYAVDRLIRDFPLLVGKSIYDVTPNQIQAFIKGRLRQDAAPATINRDLSILSHTFNLAAFTFGCAGARNPIGRTTRLRLSNDRVRRVSQEEERALAQASAAYEMSSSIRIGAVIRFACDTAMRCSEITGMQWEQVDLDRGTVFLGETKNGDSRSVPLWLEMRSLLRDVGKKDSGPVWGAHEAVRSAWRRVRAAAIASADGSGNATLATSLRDLRFHDLRHEGTSRLIERTGWDNSRIMAVTGHRDPKMLKRYTHLRSADLAAEMAKIESGGARLHLVETTGREAQEDGLPASLRMRAAWHAVANNKSLLQALVDVRPIRDIASDFGVSDVAVHKACAKLGVEKKRRGHWLSDEANAA